MLYSVQDGAYHKNTNSKTVTKIRIAFWASAIVLGAIQAWSEMHSMNYDGLSYLGIADAYLQKDWHNALSAYWSPLYSWILALSLAIARPSPYWEFAVAHATNFVIYLVAAVSFEFLLAQLIRYNRQTSDTNRASEKLPDWALMGFSYLLFLWSSLELVSLRLVAPDMSVTALVYLAVGILLRIRAEDGKQHSSLAWAALLGLVLGIGYLAKTVMLPLSFGFLAVLLIGPGRFREKVLQLGIALVILSLVAAPFVIAISKARGYFTFGESGKCNYIVFVNLGSGRGRPVHPQRELVKGLGVYTKSDYKNAPSYDPSYWMEGVKPRFNLKQQLKRLILSARDYYALLLMDPFGACILTCILILLLGAMPPEQNGIREFAREAPKYIPLILPGLLGLSIYALVLVESRYVASFVVLLGVAFFTIVNLRNTEHFALISSVLLAGALVFVVTTGAVSVRHFQIQLPEHPEWETTEHLLRLGVRQGNRVGIIGRPGYWPRIARVIVVAQMKPERESEPFYVCRFWFADRETRQRVLDAMAEVGASAVVATNVPPFADTTGWVRLGNTDRYAWLVKDKLSN